jgi:hypothetical protein
MPPNSKPGPLWAITSYFNPAGYRTRLENYRRFRQQLAVPLVTVEWSREGRFALEQPDADVLVQLRGGDVMWQKERLLNQALRSLPSNCEVVAWLDCDVLFEDDGWVGRTCEALRRDWVVHLFDERRNLPRHPAGNEFACFHEFESAASVVTKLIAGTATPADLDSGAPVTCRTTAGLAWASRRELVEQHGFYDACILGSGDRAILLAGLGEFDCAAQGLRMNSARRCHYLSWAKPFFDSVRGRVGHISGRVFHLWHGELGDRRYSERHGARELIDFDPATDLALDVHGCWKWNSAKPELHEYVRNYFSSRREDGPTADPRALDRVSRVQE